jgi:thioredoxin-related protein
MKYILLILLFVSSLLSFEWSDDYDGAFQKAKKEHKNVYVMIGSANCPYCSKMKNTTFSDKEVISKLEKEYVYIYLSRDIDDIPSQFTMPYSPAHYFLDTNKEIIYSSAGYKDKKSFFKILKEIKELSEF